MRYEHVTSLKWMQKRQNYITSSDVAKLVPYTATGRKRNITDNDYFQLMAEKEKILTIDDCVSVGAAARGHILEPHAIKEANKFIPDNKLYHWDDVCLHVGYAGYSPDALDVPQVNSARPYEATVIGEVKCYSPAKHIIKSKQKLKDMEERWQLAMAFYVLPKLSYAYLILFNPGVREGKLYIKKYSRSMFENELEIIDTIIRRWAEVKEYFNSYLLSMSYSTPVTEEELYVQWQAEEEAKQRKLQEGLLPSK